jgi:hypothetical protein
VKDEEIQALLRKIDDPVWWEYPPGFAHQEASTRFRNFVCQLEQTLGIALETETGAAIQDASFHSQVRIPSQDSVVTLRFSNFGEMVALSEEESVAADVVDTIRRLALLLGYVYVPTRLLTTPYTGKNPGVTGIEDWWTRYFDWV